MSSGLVMPKVIQNSTIVYGIGWATVAPLLAIEALAANSVRRLPLFASSDWVPPFSRSAPAIARVLAGALEPRSLYYGDELLRSGMAMIRRVAAVAAAPDGVRSRRLPRLRDAWHGHGAQAIAF